MNYIITGLVSIVVAVLMTGAMVNDGVDGKNGKDGMNAVGATIGSDIYQDVSFQGATAITEKTITVSDDYTLQAFESGATVYATASGSTTTLPVAKEGLFFKFVVAGALDTVNWIIDSAEGDNIEGSLIVAGAVVDCDAEDQVNFVTDGENLGDFLEVRSDGSNWYITQSNALTTAKLTCTDPS